MSRAFLIFLAIFCFFVSLSVSIHDSILLDVTSFHTMRVLILAAKDASGTNNLASRYSQYQPQSSGHPKVGTYCPRIGVVAAIPRSSSRILYVPYGTSLTIPLSTTGT